VPENRALTGFGDAVCVPVVEWIARSLLNAMAESLGGQGNRRLAVGDAA